MLWAVSVINVGDGEGLMTHNFSKASRYSRRLSFGMKAPPRLGKKNLSIKDLKLSL